MESQCPNNAETGQSAHGVSQAIDDGRAGLASPGHPPALSQPNLCWILLAAPRAWGDALLCDPTALRAGRCKEVSSNRREVKQPTHDWKKWGSSP